MAENILFTFTLFFIIAVLYSSVGHAGASGYLAVMALLSFAPDSIKPTSLVLNIIVAAIASYKYIQAGYFDKKLFLAFIFTSIPAAFIGGYITMDPKYFRLLAGIFLIISAIMLLLNAYLKPSERESKAMPLSIGLGLGFVIGIVSGLVGVGGGIFLSPILIIANWTTPKKASGIAALFILVNSIAGLGGKLTVLTHLDKNIFYWIPAVVVGGIIGSYMGANKFSNKVIKVCLFIILLLAGLKFVFVDFAK